MNEIKLLDCTLRDGGYQNDWCFGHDDLVSIFERIVEAGIDIIEVGFLDERRSFDINRSIMPDTDSVNRIYGDLDRKNTDVVAMIDYGTCSLKNIKPKSDSFLDGIRVIFKKHLRREAMEFCGQLKELGYKVFAQLVSITSYTDEEMNDLISIANRIRPYAVSMVDTYGLMHCDNLMHYFTMLDENLDPGIALGYHAHNNFQMGYSNCISMISNKTDRTLLADGSLYGMGKSAGNAPTELIAMYMNEKLGKQYHISQLLEAIDSNILQFTSQPAWGYSMFYFLSASNRCHPNYVTYLMNKRTLSVKSINEILSSLEGDKRLLYDKNYIEQLYMKYQAKDIDDTASKAQLSELLSDKDILIVGPGKSIQTEREKILDFCSCNDLIIISINYIPDYLEPDHIFVSNSKRYVQLAAALSRKKYSVIATSNVTCAGQGFDHVLNVSPLLDLNAEFIDNSLVMLLRALCGINVRKVYLAGFDGYSSSSANYYNINMEYESARQKADYLNKYTSDFIMSIRDKLAVGFLTKSRYCGENYDEQI
ncbi:MAG: aldolase catalytic domain-containing protein [Oscillospiraceae bacterium]